MTSSQHGGDGQPAMAMVWKDTAPPITGGCFAECGVDFRCRSGQVGGAAVQVEGAPEQVGGGAGCRW